MKYAVDAEHPMNDLFAYRQEESAGQNGLRQLDEDNKKRVEAYRECIENMDRLITVRTNIQILQEQLDQHLSGPVAAEVQAVRMGDFVLVTFPGEAFAEVGLRIKKGSPMPKTFVAAYSNGWIGYAPTTDCYGKGAAYEDCADATRARVAGDVREEGAGDDRAIGEVRRGEGRGAGTRGEGNDGLDPSRCCFSRETVQHFFGARCGVV